MFLKKILEIRHTLVWRLTLWYAGIFTLSSCVAFLLFYFLITSVIRQQTDEELLNQVGQFSTLLNLRGIEAVKRVAILEARAAGVKKIFFRLLYPNGEVFSSSNMSYWQDIGVSRQAIGQLLAGGGHYFDTVIIPNHKHKVRILYGIIGPGILLQLGQSMENYTHFIRAFQKMFIATMALLILLAALVGWFMAKRALSGVEAVTRTARNISSSELQQRVPVKDRGDEIDLLALTFNQMLDRIQTLVTGIREMSDNLAHDLKSPVTRIRGLAEITLTAGKSTLEFENMAASTIEECDRLLDMINTMLTISKTEAGVDRPQFAQLDLASVVRHACELFQPAAEDKQVSLVCRIPDSVALYGDNRMIQRMIANLLDNAIKYTPSNGTVTVTLRVDSNGQINASISDTGIGMASGDIPHIFKRFYRCDHSRSQTGTGLGLSLARAIAQAHKGNISVHSLPDSGSTFTVTLPAPTTGGDIR
jgi:heavy metal sensor kinase